MSVRYESVEAVRQLMQFGDHILVTEPSTARQRIAELADDLATRHAAVGPEPPNGPINAAEKGI